MSQTFEFYAARAIEAEKEAASATLDNVRDRSLRAAKTWNALAAQAQRVTQNRLKAESAKLAQRHDLLIANAG